MLKQADAPKDQGETRCKKRRESTTLFLKYGLCSIPFQRAQRQREKKDPLQNFVQNGHLRPRKPRPCSQSSRLSLQAHPSLSLVSLSHTPALALAHTVIQHFRAVDVSVLRYRILTNIRIQGPANAEHHVLTQLVLQ